MTLHLTEKNHRKKQMTVSIKHSTFSVIIVVGRLPLKKVKRIVKKTKRLPDIFVANIFILFHSPFRFLIDPPVEDSLTTREALRAAALFVDPYQRMDQLDLMQTCICVEILFIFLVG